MYRYRFRFQCENSWLHTMGNLHFYTATAARNSGGSRSTLEQLSDQATTVEGPHHMWLIRC